MNVIKANNLKTPALSTKGMGELLVSLADFSGPEDLLPAILGTENWPGREAVHRVYFAGLRTIAELKELDESRLGPVSWRFFMGGHKTMTQVSACWVTDEYPGAPVKVMGVIRGPAMADILTSTEMLNDLSEVSGNPNHHYELRVLRIPALYIEAFWLKSLSAERRDLVVPYGLIPDGQNLIKIGGKGRLARQHAYPVAEFLKVVGEAARQRLTQPDIAAFALRPAPRKTPLEPSERPSLPRPRPGESFLMEGVYWDRSGEAAKPRSEPSSEVRPAVL